MIEKIILAPYYFAMTLFGWVFDLPWGWVRTMAFYILLPVIVPVAMYAEHIAEKEERIKRETGG